MAPPMAGPAVELDHDQDIYSSSYLLRPALQEDLSGNDICFDADAAEKEACARLMKAPQG